MIEPNRALQQQQKRLRYTIVSKQLLFFILTFIIQQNEMSLVFIDIQQLQV